MSYFHELFPFPACLYFTHKNKHLTQLSSKTCTYMLTVFCSGSEFSTQFHPCFLSFVFSLIKQTKNCLPYTHRHGWHNNKRILFETLSDILTPFLCVSLCFDQEPEFTGADVHISYLHFDLSSQCPYQRHFWNDSLCCSSKCMSGKILEEKNQYETVCFHLVETSGNTSVCLGMELICILFFFLAENTW